MRRLILSFFLSVMTFSVAASSVLDSAFDHSRWDGLLKKHVVSINQGVATQVDYGGFARDRFQLKGYLSSLESVSQATFERWSKPEQLAFLINAYNAWTVELVLTGYPGIESIKDLGSWLQSPWQKTFIPLLGKPRSLDDIEHGLIRAEGKYQEPRIHFAVNCASIGCPALSATAYNGANIETQLDEAAQYFLSDRSRNRLEESRLNISMIFKWYREDFERGWGGYQRLEQFLSAYGDSLGLSAADIQRLNSGAIEIEFLDYDWNLNRK